MESDREGLVYWKPATKMEPLTCRWYAWTHLISPTTHALNLAFRQIPALQSFLASPSVHEAAARDPTALCGPFVQLSTHDVPAIRALLDSTRRSCAGLLTFAEDLRRLDEHLQRHATGKCLDEHYARLPASLAGIVELAYDTHNHPGLRIMEELLDESLDNRHTQELSLYRGTDPARKFFLNTPRLAAPDRLDLALAFSDPRVDLLASLRTRGATSAHVASELGLSPDQKDQFTELVCTEAPVRHAPEYAGEGVRVRYFGHACVLVQSASASVLFDPVVAWDADLPGARLTFNDLPDRIDCVVLTHNHQDHVCPEVLLQLRRRVGEVVVPQNNRNSVADPSMTFALRRLGITNVEEVAPLTRIDLPRGSITTVPFLGEHAGLDIHTKQGALVELAGRRLLFLADSDCRDPALYRRLARHLGRIDALFIGMECDGAPLSWLYGPYLTATVTRQHDESRRLSGADCERAWAVIEALGCRNVYIYAMGQEPWLRYLLGLEYGPDAVQIKESDRLIERCRAHEIRAERLHGCCELRF